MDDSAVIGMMIGVLLGVLLLILLIVAGFACVTGCCKKKPTTVESAETPLD